MWTTEHRLTVDAPPEALWEQLSDVDGWGAWNDGIESIRLDGPLAVGAGFAMTLPDGEVVRSTIADLEPGRSLVDETDMGDLVVRVTHLLEPHPGGGTTIIYRLEVTGEAADERGEQVGTAVSADFPDVIAALAATAGGRPT